MIKNFHSVFKCNLVNKNVRSSYRLSTSVVNRKNLSETRQAKPAYLSVPDFYAGKSVFLTGATGFLGRIMIERLLYTCKDIEKIYILMRAKKDSSMQQRLHELLNNPVFTKLKKTRPQDLSKIVPIAGDVGDARLGMSLDDENTVIEKVSVIFHTAANVKFRAPLADLLHVNHGGTEKVMELGKKMKNLDVFVYASTAFNNSEDPLVDEISYPPPRNLEDTYKVIANQGKNGNEVRKLLDKWGNSYIFSKKMAEAYVATNHGDMPTVIVRPSMVTSVYQDPLVGYTDSWVVGTGLLCDIASGLTRVVYGKKDVVVEIIPVDYVCNFLIVAAAKNSRNGTCNVYNISTGHSNPIKWGKLSELYIKEGKKHHYVIMPFPTVYFTRIEWVISVLTFLTQVLPAFTADTWLRLTGRQPRYFKLQKRATSRAVLARTATASSWDLRTAKARQLLSTLDAKDQQIFPCDPVTIDWEKYVPIYCKGVKDYMLGHKNKSGGPKS